MLIENSCLAILALFLTFMTVEFYFKVFFAQPDSIRTLARLSWRDRYDANTFNSLGYRDVEWTDEKVAGKTKVMVVGDSFVQGVGIEYTKDRFSNRLAEMLGADYVVFNLGREGTETGHHIESIVTYPYSPDILVLSYFINDIEGSARYHWPDKPPDPKISPRLKPIVNKSHAINFVYWRLYRMFNLGPEYDQWPWLLSVYNDPETFWLHKQELLSISEGAKSEQIPFLVVVFPAMNDIEATRVVTNQIIELFSGEDIPTLDVADLIEDYPTSELIVSPVDTHPNEFVNKLVAEALYQKFIELELINE